MCLPYQPISAKPINNWSNCDYSFKRNCCLVSYLLDFSGFIIKLVALYTKCGERFLDNIALALHTNRIIIRIGTCIIKNPRNIKTLEDIQLPYFFHLLNRVRKIYLESLIHRIENCALIVIASYDCTHLWLQTVLITRYSLLRYLTAQQNRTIPISLNVCLNIASASEIAMQNGSVFLSGLIAAFRALCFSIHLATCAM